MPEIDYRVNAGAILVGGGHPDLAMQVLEPLMTHEGVLYTAYFNLAAAYKVTGKPTRALEAFDKGLQNPKVPNRVRADVLLDAGMVALSVREWGRAEEYFRQHIAIDPSAIIAYVGVANAMYESGCDDLARRWLDDALVINQAAELYHARAYIYLKRGG